MEVYEMRKVLTFPDAYQDFMCKCRISHTLYRDNSKTQDSGVIEKLHRNLVVVDQFNNIYC